MYYWRKPPREIFPRCILVCILHSSIFSWFRPVFYQAQPQKVRNGWSFPFITSIQPRPSPTPTATCTLQPTSVLPLPLLTGESPVPCPATAVTVTVEFSTLIASVAYPGTTFAPGTNTVTFPVESLASNPTEFSLVLDTTDFPSGASVVSRVIYSDIEGNVPDMSSLFTLSSTLECNKGGGGITAGNNADAAADSTAEDGIAVILRVSRKLQKEEEGAEEFDCSPCDDLSDAEVEELAKYENGGKLVFCDATCLDEDADLTHCNCK